MSLSGKNWIFCVENDRECYCKRSVLACLTTSMSTCSGDNTECNLFNVAPAAENVRPDGVEPGMHKYLSARGTRGTVPLCNGFGL